MAEQTLFNEGSVQVTRWQLVVQNQAYALRDITAVEIATRPLPWFVRLLFAVGIVALLIAQLNASLVLSGAALVILALAGFGWWRSRHTFILVLGTANGAKNVLVSTNRQLIDRVAQAIDAVLVQRGGRGI